MSRMTDRLSSKELVTKARKQYEDKKFSKLPAVAIELPSKGQEYPEEHPLRGGYIEMRYPTAYDEDILTNASYIKQGVVLDKLLESICVTDVDINDLIIADKEKMLLSARILAYGPEYPVTVIDPKTQKTLKRIVNLEKIQSKEFELTSDANGEFEYSIDDITLKFIFPTSKIVDNLRDTNTVSDLMNNIICEVNGDREPANIKEFIKFNFLSKQSRQFRDYIESHIPTLITEYEFEGENGSTFTAGFPFGPDLFWS